MAAVRRRRRQALQRPAGRYTVGDDAGVVVERGYGWRIVIGSKRPAELAAAIRALMGPPSAD